MRAKFLFACVLLESRGGSKAFDEALRTFQQLVDLLRPYKAQRPRDLAFALSGLAMARHVQKDYQGSLRSLAEATVLLSSAPEFDRVISALILSIRSVTNWKRGNHETAKRETEERLDKFKKILGAKHPVVNYFQVYTARLIYKSGDLQSAETMLHQGAADAKRAYGRQPRTAKTMKLLAEVLAARGQLEEAETIFQEALSINTTVLGPEHRDTQRLQSLLARTREARAKTKSKFSPSQTSPRNHPTIRRGN